LRIGICWSERKRGPAGKTAVGPKHREEGVLRSDCKLRHPAAFRSARCDSDHRHPDENFRARDDQIYKFRQKLSSPKGRAAGAWQRCEGDF